MGYKLDAVNRCLAAISEDSVSSLSSGLPDAAKAEAIVDEITRQVLSAGWHSNTSLDVELTPDIDGYIPVDDDYLRIDTSGESAYINVTVRVDPNDDTRKLFNVTDQTYVFEDPLFVDIVYYFDVDDLPYHIANYIAARSARVFQERVMGSVALDSFTIRSEAEAWAALMDAEAEAEDSNALTDSVYMREVTGRNHRLNWR